MRLIHWIVFAQLSILVHTLYRFRFHTCRKDDQPILERENLVSLRQMVFIDDGSQVPVIQARNLEKHGIKINYGSAMKQLTSNYQSGAESALRVIQFNNSDHFIVVNFFHRAYYVMKKKDEWQMNPVNTTIKPSLEHFIRVYFVCAPGNARSALILFGYQARRRSVKPIKPENPLPRPQKRSIREVKEVKVGDEIVRMCRKVKRDKRDAKKRVKSARYGTTKDDRRISQRSLLFTKVSLSMAHFGFGVVIALNSIVFLVIFHVFRKKKPAKPTGTDKDSEKKDSAKKEEPEKKKK